MLDPDKYFVPAWSMSLDSCRFPFRREIASYLSAGLEQERPVSDKGLKKKAWYVMHDFNKALRK